jgi:membrane protein involved in colicin uptake
MKAATRFAVLVSCTLGVLLGDLPLLQPGSEAEAIAGVRRRTAVRTAVVVGSVTAARYGSEAEEAREDADDYQEQAEAAQRQAAAATAEATRARAEAEAAKQQAAASAAALARTPMPVGAVVTSLPGGCTPTTRGGVQHYRCGANTFRAAFQGSQLVYVTVQP